MTDAAEILSPSPTGVPARLRIAGVGARAYAFTVDFNIRIAIAFAWYSTGAVLHSSVNAAEVSLRRPREPDLWWTYPIEIPVVVMFILYHPIVETLLRGISPGKRFVGLRIATLAGGVPNPGPLLLRNLFRLIDSAPIFYGVGLLMTMFNRNGQRLGDLAAGTLLVYDNGRSAMKVEAGSNRTDTAGPAADSTIRVNSSSCRRVVDEPVGNRRSRPPRGTAAKPRDAHSVGQSCVRSMRMRPKGSGRPGCRAARRQPRSNGSRSAKADRSDALCTGSSCADARGTAHPSSHHSDHSTPIDRRHERAGVSNDTLMQAATRPSPSPRNEAVPPFARDRGTARHPGR